MAVMLQRGKKPTRNAYARQKQPSERKVSISFSGFSGFFSWMSILAAVTLLLLMISVGLLYAYRIATTNDYFAVKYIEISGNLRLNDEQVLASAGLAQGGNSLSINIAEVEAGLLRNPWVAEVAVKRLLPDRFAIKVTERVPAFWVRKDDGLFYADVHGRIIAPVGAGTFTSLPTLEVELGGDELLERMPECIGDLKAAQLPVEVAMVSWVKLSASRGVELYIENRDLRLSIAAEDWKGNLDRLGRALTDLGRRGELKYVREVKAADGSVWVVRDPADT